MLIVVNAQIILCTSLKVVKRLYKGKSRQPYLLNHDGYDVLPFRHQQVSKTEKRICLCQGNVWLLN